MPDYHHFTTLEVWKAYFPFRLTFSHNLASRKGAETLIVIVGDSRGRRGYGQVLPRSYLTGETMDGAAEAIREQWWPELLRLTLPDGMQRDALLEALRPLYETADAKRLTASYAGVDVAAFSLLAGTAPHGSEAENFPLVGVISAASPGKAAWTARIMRWLGYRHFKIKVGQDVGADRERVAAVRRAVGEGAWLAVDANAAWGWSEAIGRMRELAECRISVVEEPLRPEVAKKECCRRLEEMTGIAVMADESLCTFSDARELITRGGPSWWNIRLAKNGGISGVARLASLAREHGVRLYGGILVGETGALAAAGRDIFPRLGFECGEYGFSRVFLRDDPFRASPAGYRGRYAKVDDWGGLRLVEKKLHKNGECLYRLSR